MFAYWLLLLRPRDDSIRGFASDGVVFSYIVQTPHWHLPPHLFLIRLILGRADVFYGASNPMVELVNRVFLVFVTVAVARRSAENAGGINTASPTQQEFRAAVFPLGFTLVCKDQYSMCNESSLLRHSPDQSNHRSGYVQTSGCSAFSRSQARRDCHDRAQRL